MTAGATLSGPTSVPVYDGAEAFVELLRNNGVEYIFINSGTDTFPVLEAVSRMIEQERAAPQVLLCLDETTAMAAAHGYYQATGRPQVVMVHVDAGTMAIGGAYHNAQRDHAGVVVCAGRAPATIDAGVAGERDNSIHWTQEQRDQAGPVRTFTKWDYELRRVETMPLVVHKAFQVAASDPPGPVYLMIAREVLRERMEEVKLPPAARHGPPVTPAPDPDAVEQIADWLLGAVRPVIVPGSYGRNPGAVDALVSLAEAVGASVVVDRARIRASFPTTHPLTARSAQEALDEADVVLVFDSDVPWVPGHGGPPPGARIAWIDNDPTKETIPLWTFGCDLLVHAASDKAVPALLRAIEAKRTPQAQQRIAERSSRLAQQTEASRTRSRELAEGLASHKPISPNWLAHCLNEVLPKEAIVLAEPVSSATEFSKHFDRELPGTIYQSGGSSLGWALGAAIGHKLAAPQRDVVALVGDGAFVFGCPTSSLWGAEQYGAPFLTVIFNNSMHFATKRALEGGYPDSASRRMDRWVGSDIVPSPDYAVLAHASRAYGERVEEPAEVMPALRRGLERIRAGQAAVLDVQIERF